MVVEKDTYLDLVAKFRSLGHVQRLPAYSKIHCIDCARIDPGGRKALAKFPKDPRTVSSVFSSHSHLEWVLNSCSPSRARLHPFFCTLMRDMLMDCLSIHIYPLTWQGGRRYGRLSLLRFAIHGTSSFGSLPLSQQLERQDVVGRCLPSQGNCTDRSVSSITLGNRSESKIIS